ncbi:hypothetical protein BH10ACI4_BH10ACI4_30200 [soil metagenome]
MYVRHLLPAALLMMFATSPLTAHADLIGTSITGSLAFNGSSVNSFAPTVATIGPGVEFSYTDVVNIDFADFSGNGLTVSDTCLLSANDCAFNYAWIMQFTDSAFTGLTFTNLTNALNVTYSLVGDTITITYPGGAPLKLAASSTFSLQSSSSPIPEPSTITLLGTGIMGIANLVRRRIRRSA